MAPSLGVLSEKATSYADVIALYCAEATGAAFGVIEGLVIVGTTLLGELSLLKTPDGRKQLIYGREGPTKEKKETIEEASQAVGSAKDKLSNATASVTNNARSTVSKTADSFSKTTQSSKTSHSSSSSHSGNGVTLPVSNKADPAASPTKPMLSDTHEAVALGPGAPLPPIKEVKAAATTKTTHENPNGTKTTKRAAATSKGNGDHLDPVPTEADAPAEAGLPIEYEAEGKYEAEGSVPSTTSTPRSLQSTDTEEPSLKRKEKKVLRKLKSVFKSGGVKS